MNICQSTISCLPSERVYQALSPGLITRLQVPGGPCLRSPQGHPHYNSLVAKLLVHFPMRAKRRGLAKFHVQGINATIPILRDLMPDKAFQADKVDTTHIEPEYQNKE
jgi:acetyl/propionyl-CoA carboxylase alpha subunit